MLNMIKKTWRSRKRCKKTMKNIIARVKKGNLSIGVPRPDNKGFVYRLGRLFAELKQYHETATIIKAIIANFPLLEQKNKQELN